MKKLVLHIGMMKTGTTFIQKILNLNYEALKCRKVIYPALGAFNHQSAFYGLCGSDIYWNKVENDSDKASSLKLLNSIQCADPDDTLILSSEALSTLNEKGIENLIKKIGCPDKVILTVRNLQRTIPSAWQQYIKGGNLKGYEDFYQSLIKNRKSLSGPWRTYSYGEVVSRWSKFCNVDVIVVDEGSKEELWNNFCASLELDDFELDIAIQPSESNISLSLEDVFILQRLIELAFGNESSIQNREKKKILDGFLKDFVFPSVATVKGTKILPLKKYRSIVNSWNEEEFLKVYECSTSIIGNVDVLKSYKGSYIDLDSVLQSELLDHFLYRINSSLLRGWK